MLLLNPFCLFHCTWTYICISMCLYIATSIELKPSSASGCAKGGSRNQTLVCHPHNSRRSKSSFNIGSKGFVKSQNTPQNSEAYKTPKAKNMFNKNRKNNEKHTSLVNFPMISSLFRDQYTKAIPKLSFPTPRYKARECAGFVKDPKNQTHHHQIKG